VQPFTPSSHPSHACDRLVRALTRAQQGRAGALDELLASAQGLLRATIGRRLRGGWSESWIDDVVQEALLDVARSYHGCRAAEEREAIAWVDAIARREVASLFRREGAARLEPLGPDIQQPHLDVIAPRWATMLQHLSSELSGLSGDAQFLLWARLLGQVTWAEAGQALGIPGSAAKRRYQRLLARLRKHCPAPPEETPAPRREHPAQESYRLNPCE
jgi:DNA-directed RNA polymerase specialized sigma24 family protein